MGNEVKVCRLNTPNSIEFAKTMTFKNGRMKDITEEGKLILARNILTLYCTSKNIKDEWVNKITAEQLADYWDKLQNTIPEVATVNEATKILEALNAIDRNDIIHKFQGNIDRDRTNGTSYYIKEDDGKYHEYTRVHTLMGDIS